MDLKLEKADFSRRGFWQSSLGLVFFTALPNAAKANMGKDDDNREERIDNYYSTREYGRLSDSLVATIVQRGKYPTITGYSPAVSKLFFQMLHARRTAARSLMRDLRKLTNPRDVIKRLWTEEKEAGDLVTKLEKKIQAIKDQNSLGYKATFKWKQAQRALADAETYENNVTEIISLLRAGK